MSIQRGSITVQTNGENASLYADAQQSASWLTQAERRPVKLTGAVANAIVFYRASMAKCIACQAGQKCDVHGTDALRPPTAQSDVATEDFQRITHTYFACFTEARGERPTFSASDGTAVKRLIKAAGVERAEQAIRAAFSDSYWRSKATIATIASDPSRHLGAANGSTRSTLQADSGFEGHGKEIR